ncbi:hypothetical protein AYI68_g8015 [Smittium mucronatum]|uniref:Uncharacterized protein n=1 Tax=Smittium mucronatum TaxID=133383 RepID=A0A1R0GM51_9FUNG|nr:hypothetical protein AYI68_g8015 [Smittium mucronatum]
MVRDQQPLKLPKMEPYLTNSTESMQRTYKKDPGDIYVGISHMVSGPYGSVNFSATNSAGNHDHTRSKKISGVSSKLKVSEIMALVASFPTKDMSDVAPDTALSDSGF